MTPRRLMQIKWKFYELFAKTHNVSQKPSSDFFNAEHLGGCLNKISLLSMPPRSIVKSRSTATTVTQTKFHGSARKLSSSRVPSRSISSNLILNCHVRTRTSVLRAATSFTMISMISNSTTRWANSSSSITISRRATRVSMRSSSTVNVSVRNCSLVGIQKTVSTRCGTIARASSSARHGTAT